MNTHSKLIQLICFISLCSSCSKESMSKDDCYLKAFEDFKAKKISVKIEAYKFNGETVYFMDDAAYTYDGYSYFINKACDTVCVRGGLKPAEPCLSALVFEELIWKK